MEIAEGNLSIKTLESVTPVKETKREIKYGIDLKHLVKRGKINKGNEVSLESAIKGKNIINKFFFLEVVQ